MKKTVLLLVTMFALATNSNAQDGGFSNGDKLLNIGVGVNSYYDNGIPLGVSYEKGISDAFSIGVDFNYLSSKYDFGNEEIFGNGFDLKFTSLYIGARASYHLNEIFGIYNSRIDTYAGGTLGYRSFSWTDSDNDSADLLGKNYGSGIYLGGLVGAKYYFTDQIGAFIELGATGSSNARVGIAFKL